MADQMSKDTEWNLDVVLESASDLVLCKPVLVGATSLLLSALNKKMWLRHGYKPSRVLKTEARRES
jgi:hypothetical protein